MNNDHEPQAESNVNTGKIPSSPENAHQSSSPKGLRQQAVDQGRADLSQIEKCLDNSLEEALKTLSLNHQEKNIVKEAFFNEVYITGGDSPNQFGTVHYLEKSGLLYVEVNAFFDAFTSPREVLENHYAKAKSSLITSTPKINEKTEKTEKTEIKPISDKSSIPAVDLFQTTNLNAALTPQSEPEPINTFNDAKITKETQTEPLIIAEDDPIVEHEIIETTLPRRPRPIMLSISKEEGLERVKIEQEIQILERASTEFEEAIVRKKNILASLTADIDNNPLLQRYEPEEQRLINRAIAERASEKLEGLGPEGYLTIEGYQGRYGDNMEQIYIAFINHQRHEINIDELLDHYEFTPPHEVAQYHEQQRAKFKEPLDALKATQSLYHQKEEIMFAMAEQSNADIALAGRAITKGSSEGASITEDSLHEQENKIAHKIERVNALMASLKAMTADEFAEFMASHGLHLQPNSNNQRIADRLPVEAHDMAYVTAIKRHAADLIAISAGEYVKKMTENFTDPAISPEKPTIENNLKTSDRSLKPQENIGDLFSNQLNNPKMAYYFNDTDEYAILKRE